MIVGKILFAHAFKLRIYLQDHSWYNVDYIDDSLWKITDSGNKLSAHKDLLIETKWSKQSKKNFLSN